MKQRWYQYLADCSHQEILAIVTSWWASRLGSHLTREGSEVRMRNRKVVISCLSYPITFSRCHCPYQRGVQWGGGPSATTWCELQWIRVHFAQLYTQHHAPVPLWKVWRCWCSMPRFVCVWVCEYGCVLVRVCLCVWDIQYACILSLMEFTALFVLFYSCFHSQWKL